MICIRRRLATGTSSPCLLPRCSPFQRRASSAAVDVGLAAVYVIPRLCMKVLRPGVTYPNFGFHYLLQSIVRGVSNSGFFISLFGDSSFITTYMRYVGWNLNTVYQTGSNMGTEQGHDNPLLCNIGSGTTTADGLKMINMQMSATSFRLAESKIGDNNFLGNGISYPPNGRTGTNVLLGTKTMVPIDGPVHENIGLLGSPAFEIPRKVDRDRDFNASFDEQTRLARLRQKNSHNFFTALIFLASQGVAMFVTLVLGQAAFANFDRFGIFAFFAASVAIIAVNMAFFIVLERASLGFKPLKPQLASVYDPYFWSHERYWKLYALPILAMFAGTPFRGMLLACHRHEGRCQAVRWRHRHPGTLAGRGRRLRQSERGLCVAGTLARGRRVQVRLHPARQQMLAWPGGLYSLRRQHRRRRRARRRFLPDEGRDPGLSYWVVWKSGQAGAPPGGSGRGLRPARRRRHRPKRAIPRVNRISIHYHHYMPENPVAKPFLRQLRLRGGGGTR